MLRNSEWQRKHGNRKPKLHDGYITGVMQKLIKYAECNILTGMAQKSADQVAVTNMRAFESARTDALGGAALFSIISHSLGDLHHAFDLARPAQLQLLE